MTAGSRGSQLLQDVWFLEKLAHFDREVIPERRMHAKGSAAYGTFTVSNDITRYTRAKIFSKIGKKTELFARFSTYACIVSMDGMAPIPSRGTKKLRPNSCLFRDSGCHNNGNSILQKYVKLSNKN